MERPWSLLLTAVCATKPCPNPPPPPPRHTHTHTSCALVRPESTPISKFIVVFAMIYSSYFYSSYFKYSGTYTAPPPLQLDYSNDVLGTSRLVLWLAGDLEIWVSWVSSFPRNCCMVSQVLLTLDRFTDEGIVVPCVHV